MSSTKHFIMLAVVGSMPLLAVAQEPSRPEPIQMTEKGLAIHKEALVFDGHNGLPWKLRGLTSQGLHLDLLREQKRLHTDIPRLRKGGVGAQFWAVFVPPAVAKKGNILKDTLEEIDHLHQLIQKYPEDLEIAYKADDIYSIRKRDRIASLIGVEGGYAIENSLAVLRTFQQLGVRYMTLVHADNTDWADAARAKPKNQGLSQFGESVVLEMNRLGIIVDLAHSSVDTMKHTLLLSKAPVMFSHAGAHAVAPHLRNLPDEVLRLVAKNGGIVMVNFYPAFLTPAGAKAYEDRNRAAHKLRSSYTSDAQYRLALAKWLQENPLPPATVKDLVNHIDHIVKVAGIDHVGLGSNFDGMVSLTRQLEDVSCFPFITQELVNRGYTREQIHQILGENMLRVLREAEYVAHNGNGRRPVVNQLSVKK